MQASKLSPGLEDKRYFCQIKIIKMEMWKKEKTTIPLTNHILMFKKETKNRVKRKEIINTV